MSNKDYVFVEGVDYSAEGIEALRQQAIEWRNEAYAQMPESAGFVVGISHVIAVLHYAKALQENQGEK